LPTFGIVRFPKTPTGEVVISVPGETEWRISGGRPLLHPAWQAVEPQGRVMATLTRNDQRVVYGDRELTLRFKPATFLKGAGPWVVSENGSEFFRIPRRYWGRKRIVVTIVDEQAARSDPRLTLFLAWSACRLSSAQGVL
jgi:hypothetical protein